MEGWRWVKLTPSGFEEIGKDGDEKCRWFVAPGFYNGSDFEDAALEPDSHQIVWGAAAVPDYYTDLNAVHRLELELERRGKGDELWEELFAASGRVLKDAVFAPASVRFRAVCAVCGWEVGDDE